MDCLITLRSVTYSMKAQMLLSQNGISVSAVKLDGSYAGRGCTHGLRFDCKNRKTVERILRQNNVQYSDIKNL